MKCTVFLLLLIFLTSCVQKDSHPERKDEIYNDLLAELEIATKQLEGEEKNLVLLKQELSKAVPQTGQIKYASKKVLAAEESINITKQRKIFFEIKAERRKSYVQQRYEESLSKDGRPWPDAKEVEVYKSISKFNREKMEWDKNKGIKKGVPRGTEATGGK